MLTRTAFGLAIILATASGALAASKHQPVAPAQQQNVRNAGGVYVGTDPDPAIRFQLSRDWSHGRS